MLYISLTGMTEPLGRSQVLEYLFDLSKENKISLISFEREKDLKDIEDIKKLIKVHNIEWNYFTYSNKYGIFSTIYQLGQAIFLGRKLLKRENINIVHARSMIPATMGLVLKKFYGVKLIFDIRGFAIDEKVDSGRLKKNGILYHILKKLDDYLYKSADHVVTLTHKAKDILSKDLSISRDRITVIPTCANRDVFKLLDEKEKTLFKKSLGYKESDKIIIHTGTVSGWYDFESEVRFVMELIKQDENIHFLILNKGEHDFIKRVVEQYSFSQKHILISSCAFDEMYKYLNIADASLFFILPSYSKQASAPTKFAENVACHLPSITNGGVGDMEYYLTSYSVGCLVDLNRMDKDLKKSVNLILERLDKNDFLQNNFEKLFDEHFDKKMAVEKYDSIYKNLI